MGDWEIDGTEAVAPVVHCSSSVSWGRDDPRMHSHPLDVAYDEISQRAVI